MRVVSKAEFTGTRADLQAAVVAYKAALETHKTTVGQPAPWPQYDVLRFLVNLDSTQWILESELIPDAPAPEEVTYRDLRAVAYRDQLGTDKGDFIKTLGDVLDVLIAQVESMRQTAGATATPAYTQMLTKIQAIKAEYPKPAP